MQDFDGENLLHCFLEVSKDPRQWLSPILDPAKRYSAIRVPVELRDASYQVRVTLQKLKPLSVLHVVIPVGNRMCGFDLEGIYSGNVRSGLNMVNGVNGREVPGAVAGVKLKDAFLHDLEVTVRLDGADATITVRLDTQPLYRWTGPINALTQEAKWATTEPGKLGFGTQLDAWAVTDVKVKRLDAAAALQCGEELDRLWTTFDPQRAPK